MRQDFETFVTTKARTLGGEFVGLRRSMHVRVLHVPTGPGNADEIGRDFSLHVHVYTIPYTYTVYTSTFKAYTVYCTSHLLINNTMKNLSAPTGRL